MTVLLSRTMGPVQANKRAFVKVLLRIAALYHFVCGVSRDSTDAELNSAFRKVAAKCHPDKVPQRGPVDV